MYVRELGLLGTENKTKSPFIESLALVNRFGRRLLNSGRGMFHLSVAWNALPRIRALSDNLA